MRRFTFRVHGDNLGPDVQKALENAGIETHEIRASNGKILLQVVITADDREAAQWRILQIVPRGCRVTTR
jgi:hypothetical protein